MIEIHVLIFCTFAFWVCGRSENIDEIFFLPVKSIFVGLEYTVIDD